MNVHDSGVNPCRKVGRGGGGDIEICLQKTKNAA